jgi:hypothetical protein
VGRNCASCREGGVSGGYVGVAVGIVYQKARDSLRSYSGGCVVRAASRVPLYAQPGSRIIEAWALSLES